MLLFLAAIDGYSRGGMISVSCMQGLLAMRTGLAGPAAGSR